MLGGLRWVLLVLVLLSTSTVSTMAFAQSADAQKLLNEGDRAGTAGKWEEALDLFQKARDLPSDKDKPSANIERRIANALYKLDRRLQAIDAYEQLLQHFGTKLSAGDKKTAQDRVKELKDKTGTITIRVIQIGATVTLDDGALGTSPLAKPVRVLPGQHTIKVTKDGFQPLEKSVDVAAKANQSVELELTPVPPVGTVSVTVKGANDTHIYIDGNDVGTAPWKGTLPPGTYTVSARSPTHRAQDTKVDVVAAQVSNVELEAAAIPATLEVRVEPTGAKVLVDGKEVSEGTFKGELPVGEHVVAVTAEGYETFEINVTLAPGETRAETVVLRKATEGTVVEPIEKEWTFDGLYGGLALVGMFEPGGSGNSLSTSCPALGATTCQGGTPLGGGLGFHIGYAFAPIGLELYILAAGDVVSPHASFDGVTGSDINPLVAAPAREEDFIIGRFGGGGALRLRLLFPFDIFRFTVAVGAGVGYRHMLYKRDTVADNGATSSVGNEDGSGYVTPVFNAELGGQVLIAGTTAFTFGFHLWLEHAGDGVTTESRGDVFLVREGEIPQPHATPAYDLAAGTQVFIGPSVGLAFGP